MPRESGLWEQEGETVGIISFRHRGNFNKTEKFFNRLLGREYLNILDHYGQMGVDALSSATPVDTGKTASSWFYEIERSGGGISISWHNDNINQSVNIAVILQFGHGTGTGGYVQGRDYINPAIRPVFDKIADESWKEVVSL